MKKVIIASLTAILVICFFAFKSRLSQESVFFQDNIEALADDEGDFGICYSQYHFHLTKRCLKCGTCNWAWGEGEVWGGYC